jgi:hypothetical protein
VRKNLAALVVAAFAAAVLAASPEVAASPATTIRVSVASDGTDSNNSSGAKTSANGRFVAFASSAGNLVLDDTNGKSDVL